VQDSKGEETNANKIKEVVREGVPEESSNKVLETLDFSEKEI